MDSPCAGLPACVMNFATSRKAYSLYPRATFERRTSLICESDDENKSSLAHEKYAELSICIGSSGSKFGFFGLNPSKVIYFGDSTYSVRIPLVSVIAVSMHARTNPILAKTLKWVMAPNP